MTEDTFVGRFATRQRAAALRELQITDIVNVSDTPSQLTPGDGPFRTVFWIHIEDRLPIPTDSALRALDLIHCSLVESNGRVYVHCMAGWNRSPTILWLYLLACGWDSDGAKRQVGSNAFDAVPGHPLLVHPGLIEAALAHGRDNFQPHPRPASIGANAS